MVSKTDREILRAEIRSRGNKLTASDRESILRPYLPDPSELSSPPRSRASTTSSYQRRQKARKTPIRTFLKSQLHRLTYALTHIVFGIVVRLLHAYHAVIDRVFAVVYHHHRTPELIRKDVRGLKRLPQHLSVILALRTEEDALAVLMDEVAELAAWSTCAGVPQLSVYERTGMNLGSLQRRNNTDRERHRHSQIMHPDAASDHHYQVGLVLRLPLSATCLAGLCSSSSRPWDRTRP